MSRLEGTCCHDDTADGVKMAAIYYIGAVGYGIVIVYMHVVSVIVFRFYLCDKYNTFCYISMAQDPFNNLTHY